MVNYADKLKKALLYYSTYRKWCGSGCADKDPAWHSELNTARFCHGFAVGYDAVHDVMTDAERATVREAVIRLGIEPTLADWIDGTSRIHCMDYRF